RSAGAEHHPLVRLHARDHSRIAHWLRHRRVRGRLLGAQAQHHRRLGAHHRVRRHLSLRLGRAGAPAQRRLPADRLDLRAGRHSVRRLYARAVPDRGAAARERHPQPARPRCDHRVALHRGRLVQELGGRRRAGPDDRLAGDPDRGRCPVGDRAGQAPPRGAGSRAERRGRRAAHRAGVSVATEFSPGVAVSVDNRGLTREAPVMKISRRSLLAGSALAAAAMPAAALAKAPPAGKQAAGVYRYKLGDYEMTALYDGVWNRAIDEKFVRNIPFPQVQKVLSDSFLPTDKLPVPFPTLLVNTGARLILLDTGTAGQLPGGGSMIENLAAAGIAPAAIDTIVISHFHPDHINGIKTKDDAPV